VAMACKWGEAVGALVKPKPGTRINTRSQAHRTRWSAAVDARGQGGQESGAGALLDGSSADGRLNSLEPRSRRSSLTGRW
jgi:hypothetical protein